eukprot:262214-Pelagomonas_calceolata.AAC.1
MTTQNLKFSLPVRQRHTPGDVVLHALPPPFPLLLTTTQNLKSSLPVRNYPFALNNNTEPEI